VPCLTRAQSGPAGLKSSANLRDRQPTSRQRSRDRAISVPISQRDFRDRLRFGLSRLPSLRGSPSLHIKTIGALGAGSHPCVSARPVPYGRRGEFGVSSSPPSRRVCACIGTRDSSSKPDKRAVQTQAQAEPVLLSGPAGPGIGAVSRARERNRGPEFSRARRGQQRTRSSAGLRAAEKIRPEFAHRTFSRSDRTANIIERLHRPVNRTAHSARQNAEKT